MNVSPIRGGWAAVFTLLLLSILTTLAIGEDAPTPAPKPTPPPGPAAYLQRAKYITVAKCKMCHKPVFTAWDTTLHAKANKQLPWEADAANTKVPPAETVYRYTTGYNAETKTWSEKGTTCEACHGPGSEHFTATKDQRKALITDPAKLQTTGQKVSICGRCHGQYVVGDQRFAAKFQVGQDLLTTDGFKLDKPVPGKPMQEMNELVGSKHFKHDIVCLDCHTAHATPALEHALKKPVIELCTSCHKNIAMATHAPKAPATATCATCHMPKGAHTFTKPDDENGHDD